MTYKPQHRAERGSRWEWRRFDNWYAIRKLCYEEIPAGSITSLCLEDDAVTGALIMAGTIRANLYRQERL